MKSCPARVPGYSGINDQDRAAWIVLRQEQAFPRTFAKALTPTALQAPYNNVDLYFQKQLADLGITTSITSSSPAVNNNAALESSILLLMALSRGVGGTSYSADQLGSSNIRTFTINGGTKPVPALVDAWGEPYHFAFVGSTSSNGNLPQLATILVSAGKDKIFQSTFAVVNVTTNPAAATQNKVTPAGDDLPSK